MTVFGPNVKPATIVVPGTAPASVQAAAKELQHDIFLASGKTPTIKKDTEKITGSIVSVGATRQAKAAGLGTANIAAEGFRITVKGDHLYLLGPDTADGGHTNEGGTSNGTANGVYTFLEEYLGVRWLMPGELGRDVPVRDSLKIDNIDRTAAPLLINRRMPYIQKTAAVQEWQDHQKLGYSFRINHQHNWVETVPAGLFKEHPDWFAMINGKRVPPRGKNHKLESTNPELVNYYAQKAIAALKADPSLNTYSLSPSDGRGWSESPESKALYDPAPPDSTFPSITPLILKWYRDVSEIVAREYPQGKLGGYIYTDFSRPPTKGGMTLPENFIPVIVGQDFGFRFYRKDARELGSTLIREWAKVAPSTWFYYGMPIWLRNSSGLLSTASPNNLNFLFTLLRENHIKGAYLYGTAAWSQTAMANYIQAQMLWDPQRDARQLQHDWLTRAYGPAAGAVMEQLYNHMDNGAFADFFRRDPSQHYNVRETMFRDYYAPHYSEIEGYFLKAKSQPMTAIQRQRLQLIEDNLIVLQWRLRNAGYLPAAYKSPLQRTDRQVVALLTEAHDDFERFPDIIAEATVTPVKVQLKSPEAAPAATKTRTAALPNDKAILLYPTRPGPVELKPLNVHPGSAFLSYAICEAGGRTVKAIQSGILYNGETISFNAQANMPYYFEVTPTAIVAPSAVWDLSVPNAVCATARFADDTLSLEGPPSSLYLYVPSGLSLTARPETTGLLLQSASALGEALRRYPNARSVAKLDVDWRFQTDPQKSGLQQNYHQPNFDDSAWKSVTATDWWQNQGFADYHGTAWYRKTFAAPSLSEDDPQGVGATQVLLFFGAADGDATVYLNGQKIGEHLPSKLRKGWDQPFIVNATPALKPGSNTIAVQVTKDNYQGGLIKGVDLMLAEKATK